MSDDAFLEVLAGVTEACESMDLSDDGWMPPDGNFDVMIVGIATGIKEKNGVNNAWVKPSFTILDGEFKNKTFTDYYWIEPVATATIAMKNLCRFASCLAGIEVKNPIEAVEIAKAAEGEFLSVQVYRSTSKKTGKTYPNIRFLQKLEAVDTDIDEIENAGVDPAVAE